MSYDPPIQNEQKIDIVGERHDGGVDLVIVASGPLDGSDATIRILQRKIRNYLREAASDQFRKRFNAKVASRTRVVVVCEYDVDSRAHRLVSELASVAAEQDVELLLTKSME